MTFAPLDFGARHGFINLCSPNLGAKIFKQMTFDTDDPVEGALVTTKQMDSERLRHNRPAPPWPPSNKPPCTPTSL